MEVDRVHWNQLGWVTVLLRSLKMVRMGDRFLEMSSTGFKKSLVETLA